MGSGNLTMKPTAGNEVVRHGYTIADLHGIARHAVHIAGPMATNWHERYDLAWSGVVEYLFALEEDAAPYRSDLILAGRLALYAEITAERQCYGYYKAKTDGALHGMASSPAFRTYWWDWVTARTPSHETRIVDRMSVSAILPLLKPRHREALVALAVHDDYQQAADAMGIPQATFKSLISRGRKEFRQWWHEGETPSRPWGVDRRAGQQAGGPRRQGGSRATLEALRRRKRMHRQ